MKTLTLSIHYPKTILHGLQHDLEKCQQFLQESNIAPSVLQEAKARVPIESHVRLYQKIAPHIDDEAFGYLPRRLRFGTFAIACEYAANAATIGEALQKICRFYGAVTDDVSLTLKTIGKEARFMVELRRPELDTAHFVVETFMCIGFRLSSWLAGRAITLQHCNFTYTPTQNLNEYIYLFPCEHRFAQSGPNMLSFAAQYLNLPVLKTASDVEAYNRRAPLDLLNKLIGTDSLTNRVYVALSRKTEDDAQNSKIIASEMAMTEQTLRRHLRQEGNTFQKIKDSLRLDTAVFHLTNNKYTIAEISERLGFSTPSAFSRAFKGWTGATPESYRHR
ncbi:AraC family transcriptional regulator [Ferrovibrio sp.]|uniref:AraC family transcriptional regulator n=1 Tax=Ferrovibrio sp. TaxID=1917215 RepID=UPI003D12FD78